MKKRSFTYLGNRRYLTEHRPIGLWDNDRLQHIHVLGKTGTGKSTFLKTMMIQDLHNGHGFGVIDPHGDLADEILDFVPKHRINDVVYFNPADKEYPIGLNLLEHVEPARRPLVASGVVGAFKSIFGDSWGPRTEYILYATVAALLECQNVSLLGVPRMLTDDAYRTWVVRQVRDPSLRSFWIDEFNQYDPRFRREAVAPIQNKVGQVLLSPLLRNIFGQVRSGFDPSFTMDNRKIFIGSLSKGRLGADKANLLGALLVKQFELAAMRRVDTAEPIRRPFFLYVDEFSNFVTESFANILSEARKYRLGLVLSHQYMGQIDRRVEDAVLGNVGTHVTFRCGSGDSESMAREYGAILQPRQFGELPNHRAYVKLLYDGQQTEAFELGTVPSGGAWYRGRSRVIRQSRQRYAKMITEVERAIARWFAKGP